MRGPQGGQPMRARLVRVRYTIGYSSVSFPLCGKEEGSLIEGAIVHSFTLTSVSKSLRCLERSLSPSAA